MPNAARRTGILLTDLKGRVKEVDPRSIGLIIPRPWGCLLWSSDLRTCTRVGETLPQLLQALDFARTITEP